MPFPTGWPPRISSSQRSIRYFLEGEVSGNFEDNAYLFSDQAAANPYTALPFVRPGGGVSAPDYTGPHTVPTSPSGTGQKYATDLHPMLWSRRLHLTNYGSTSMEVSFDGVNTHGKIGGGQAVEYADRQEAGIAMRGGGAVALGSITTVAVANLVDGEVVIISDGIHPALTFEFDVDGAGVAPGNVRVDVHAVATANEVRDILIQAIQAEVDFWVTATNGGAATVTLANDLGGAHGNVVILHTVVDIGFVAIGMAGGDSAEFKLEVW